MTITARRCVDYEINLRERNYVLHSTRTHTVHIQWVEAQIVDFWCCWSFVKTQNTKTKKKKTLTNGIQVSAASARQQQQNK